jgi:hypothetical protein
MPGVVRGLSIPAFLGLAGAAAAVALLVVVSLGATIARYGIQPVWDFLTHPKTATLIAVTGPILGFVTAWILFEITERRKARRAQAAMRAAILGELRDAELLLSNIVLGYAFGVPASADTQRAVKELRWLLAPERGKVEGVGFFEATGTTEAALQPLRGRSDQEVAALLPHFPSTSKRRPLEVHLPVIAGVLRQPTIGLTEAQVRLLAAVRWQLQLLNDGARWTHRFFRMTFTVRDPTNHGLAVTNHDVCRNEHRQRAAWALDEVRNAIAVLTAAAR